jgi:hypothetical protein
MGLRKTDARWRAGMVNWGDDTQREMLALGNTSDLPGADMKDARETHQSTRQWSPEL